MICHGFCCNDTNLVELKHSSAFPSIFLHIVSCFVQVEVPLIKPFHLFQESQWSFFLCPFRSLPCISPVSNPKLWICWRLSIENVKVECVTKMLQWKWMIIWEIWLYLFTFLNCFYNKNFWCNFKTIWSVWSWQWAKSKLAKPILDILFQAKSSTFYQY